MGLNASFSDRYFTGTPSRIQGVGLDVLAREAKAKHDYAFRPVGESETELDLGGRYQYRVNSEHHLYNPETVAKLQQAVRGGKFETFEEFTALIDQQSRHLCTLRGLMELRTNARPVPIEEVEPATAIVKRFATGPMSFGSIPHQPPHTFAPPINPPHPPPNTPPTRQP